MRIAPWTVALSTVVLAGALAPCAVADLAPGSTTLVSRPAGALSAQLGQVGDSSVSPTAVSADGRYVAFASDSDGLLPAGMHSADSQVFRLDRTTGAVALVSHTPGGQPGSGTSSAPQISADGQTIAYYSQAPDVVAGDANDHADALVWKAATNVSIIASVADGANGAQANGFNTGVALSADGNVVAWESEATNLSPDDTSPVRSIYRRSLTFDQTTLVSRTNLGASVTSDATGASVDGDGQLITFTTAQDNLDQSVADTNGASDVYLRSVTGAKTFLVSRREGGGDPATATGAVGYRATIDDSGKHVAFTSSATDMTADVDGNSSDDVFERTDPTMGDAGTTTLVSRGNDDAYAPAISGDGSTIAFASTASDLVAGDTARTIDVFATSGATTVTLTRDGAGHPIGSTSSSVPDVSLDADGGFAVLGGAFPTLSSLDDDAFRGVYGVARSGGAPVALARPAGTTGAFRGDLSRSDVVPGGVSDDGRWVAFVSPAPGVPSADGHYVGWVKDMATGELDLVTRASGPSGAPAPAEALLISGDGRYVAFGSDSSLDPKLPRPDGTSQIYVRDRMTNTTTLVSRAGGGGPAADDSSELAALSADGHRIAFRSQASNLGGGAITNTQLFVRDTAARTTSLVSRASGANGAAADDNVSGGAISRDGNVVAFSTKAKNLAGAQPSYEAYVRNLATHTTTLVSRADGAAGAASDDSAEPVALSGNGARVLFSSRATNLGAGATGYDQVYVRDVPARRTIVASRDTGATGAIAKDTTQPGGLSADGKRALFATFDAALPSFGAVSGQQIYIRDLDAATTRLVSRANGAGGAPQVSPATYYNRPALSASGACVVWDSLASGLAPVDYANHDSAQLFMRAVDRTCAVAPPAPPGTGTGTTTTAPPPAVVPQTAPVAPPLTTPAARDRTAPTITAARVSRSRFAVARTPTALSAATRRGTRLSLRLSEAARLTVVVERRRLGRRVGSRCVAKTRKRRARRCTRYVASGTLRRAERSGSVTIDFSGRLGRRALAVGRYRMTLVATDAAGNRSKSTRLSFTVVRR